MNDSERSKMNLVRFGSFQDEYTTLRLSVIKIQSSECHPGWGRDGLSSRQN